MFTVMSDEMTMRIQSCHNVKQHIIFCNILLLKIMPMLRKVKPRKYVL